MAAGASALRNAHPQVERVCTAGFKRVERGRAAEGLAHVLSRLQLGKAKHAMVARGDRTSSLRFTQEPDATRAHRSCYPTRATGKLEARADAGQHEAGMVSDGRSVS